MCYIIAGACVVLYSQYEKREDCVLLLEGLTEGDCFLCSMWILSSVPPTATILHIEKPMTMYKPMYIVHSTYICTCRCTQCVCMSMYTLNTQRKVLLTNTHCACSTPAVAHPCGTSDCWPSTMQPLVELVPTTNTIIITIIRTAHIEQYLPNQWPYCQQPVPKCIQQ